jgi:hypothetical protein
VLVVGHARVGDSKAGLPVDTVGERS